MTIKGATLMLLISALTLGGCADRSVARQDDVSRSEAYGLVQPVAPTRQEHPQVITDPEQNLEYQRRTGDVPAAGK